MLGKIDILSEMENKNLDIVPFNENNLKGASYDITPTIIALSTRCGMLESVYCDTKYPFNYYFYVRAKDTVLVVSKEYISVPDNIAGYVISRVSNVVEGIGHVCTSIDPNWKGALLIALNNPTNKPIKICVNSKNASNNANKLATITFNYLSNGINEKTPHSGMRIDLLNQMKYSNRIGIKAFLRKKIHPYRVEFTDFFFNYCEMLSSGEMEWDEFVKPLVGESVDKCVNCSNYKKSKKKEKIDDFIIRESRISKVFNWLNTHKKIIYEVLIFILLLLAATGKLPVMIQKIADAYVKYVNN